MCYGDLDPRFSHRDIEARLGGPVRIGLPLAPAIGFAGMVLRRGLTNARAAGRRLIDMTSQSRRAARGRERA